jgi:cohesin complex subunit SA-1/2
VGEKSRIELNNYKRQLSAETKKGETSANRSKLRTLKQNSTSAQQKCKDVEEFLTEFFNSIFVHRSRDVESVIRVECIKELCSWMQGYQAYFVSNNYLRFMGWAFNDQSGSVRSEVIKSLIRLYKIEDIASKLTVFTRRFKSRIEEMALYDVDVSVRVNAIQLCSALFKLKIDVLSDAGRTKLSNMISSDVTRVRKSAAPFVKALIDTNTIDPLFEKVTTSLSEASVKSKYGRRSAAAAAAAAVAATTPIPVNKTWVNFKGLASFLVEQTAAILENENNDEMQVDLESVSSALIEKRNLMVTNIVEALWDQMKELQDFISLSDYLSRDHSQTQQQQQNDDEMDTGNTHIEDCYRLTEEEETVLINVFVVCLRTGISKGLDKNMPEGRDKKKMDEELLEENKNEISRHLVQSLPKLLSKHSDDVHRMTQLVSIPAIMNLNVYSELRAEKEYEELLETLSKLYLGAILTDLLTNCADSLQHMSNNTSLLEINNLHLNELKEAVVKQVREACSGKDLVTARYTSKLIHSISVSMIRLACLINFSDASAAMEDSQGMSMNVVEYVGALVDRATFGNEKEKNISQAALTVISRYMMWKCSSLSASSTSDVIPVIERRRDWAFDKFVELITGGDVIPLPHVRVAAFGYLVDMYWLFTSEMFDDFGLTRLKTRCPADLQKSCTDYVSKEIKNFNEFVKDADSKDEESQKKLANDKEMILKLVTSYSRGILVGVFEMNNSVFLLEQYGSNGLEIDDTIKALVSEFQEDLITGEVAADGICRAYMDALKNVSQCYFNMKGITNN